jgi:hypothetical protein
MGVHLINHPRHVTSNIHINQHGTTDKVVFLNRQNTHKKYVNPQTIFMGNTQKILPNHDYLVSANEKITDGISTLFLQQSLYNAE